MLSERIKNWSLLKIFVVFNIFSSILFSIIFIIYDSLWLDNLIYNFIEIISPNINDTYLIYEWLPAIIPLVVIFLIGKYSGERFKKRAKDARPNLTGKILVFGGIILFFLVWFIPGISELLIKLLVKYTPFIYFLFYYTYGFFIVIIISLLIIIGLVFWIKSNYNWQDTGKLLLITMSSIIIHILALISIASLYHNIF